MNLLHAISQFFAALAGLPLRGDPAPAAATAFSPQTPEASATRDTASHPPSGEMPRNVA